MMKSRFMPLCFVLAATMHGCTAPTIIRAEGPYLQLGPQDALLGEIALPDRETCQQLLVRFYSISKISTCAANSANLSYSGSARHDFWQITVQIAARTVAACDSLQAAVVRGDGWHIVDKCRQISTAAPGR